MPPIANFSTVNSQIYNPQLKSTQKVRISQSLVSNLVALVIVHEPDTKKWLLQLVPSLLNKVHVDFWEGIHEKCIILYESSDHVVACGFYGMCFTTSKISTRITLYQFI